MLNYKPKREFYLVNTTNLFQLKIYQRLERKLYDLKNHRKKLNFTYPTGPKNI